MTDDKPNAERERVEGKEVWVTKDESGVTAVSEDEDAADPRVTTPDDSDDETAEGGNGKAGDGKAGDG